jgi:phosphomannomutase
MDKVVDAGAEFAGDGSGSFAMASAAPAFDGFLAMGKILESMAAKNASSAELAGSLPKYHLRKLKIPCRVSNAYSLLKNLGDHFQDAERSDVDGHRFDWPDGWIHFRMAMTEPIIRVIIEWRTKEEAEERATRVAGLLERLLVSK